MREKVFIAFLRGAGIVLLTALIPAAMPFSYMQEIHRGIGMGDLPKEPIVGYLTRSLSLMYAMHGALICFVSLDVRRFLPVVKFFAILGMVFGSSMIVLDTMVGMPTYWTVCEGPCVIPFSLVILLLAKRVPETQGDAG